jgi:predicted phosphodiesterase
MFFDNEKGGEMQAKLKKLGRAILTGLRKVSCYLEKHPRMVTSLKLTLKLSTLVWVIFAWTMLTSPANYRITEGELTYKLSPSWTGGYTEFPLGPIGMARYKTHHTPVNLRVDLVLNKGLTKDQTLTEIRENGVATFKPDAISAFYDFLKRRLLWVMLIGAGLGVEVSNGGKRWFRKLLLILLCWGIVTLAAIGFVAVTYLTLDRTPEAKYTGMSAELLKGIPLLEKMGGDYRVDKNIFQNVIEGMKAISNQADNQVMVDPSAPRIRILAAGDFHDNFLGMQLASSLLNNKHLVPFSAVLLTGDLTDFGTRLEAEVFLNQLQAGNVPVMRADGNHENKPATDAFDAMGYAPLEGMVVNVDGLSILGDSDPLAESYLIGSDVAALDIRSKELAETWESSPVKPQVVVVHDIRQANDVIQVAKEENQPLTVIFGHDHQVSYERDGMVDLVGCGTGGASGADGVDRDPNGPYVFQVLDFSKEAVPRLLSITTFTIYGLDGPTKIENKTID